MPYGSSSDDGSPRARRGHFQAGDAQPVAAALGIALAGNLEGLFGDAATQACAHGRPAGYGPLIDDPNGLLSLPKGYR